MSTNFSFGAKTTAPPAFGTGSITFGTAPVQSTPPQFGVGVAQSQNVSGFQMGAATPAPSLFGTPTNTASSALNFKPPGFGGGVAATPNTGLSFGSPAPAAATGGLFGAQATNMPTAGGMSFGTPTVGAAQPLKSFGFATTPTAAAAPTPALGFGSPAATAPTAGLTFGTPTPIAPAGGLTFGTPVSTAPTGGLSFGAPPPATAPTGGLTFGTPASTAPATALSFGTAVAPTSVATLGGGLFGTAATTTATPSLGLSFGGSTTAASPLAFGCTPGAIHNFGQPVVTVPSSSTFGLSTAATSAPASIGLGGIATTQTKAGAAVTAQKEIPPKEQNLPNEIQQSVEHFKELVKQQKLHSSDIARCSVRDFRKVEQEIDLLNNLINEVECQLQKNRHVAEKLKYDTAKCLQNIEMAQRTQDTPPGLQYENVAPLRFFLELVDHFEREMHALKAQIDSADKYVKNHKNPESLAPQDLAMGMRRLHETFVALAGRLQSVHSQVESQKEMYINLRKNVYSDSNNPFEKLTQTPDLLATNLKKALIYSPPKVASGPTPFNNLALGNGNIVMQQQSQAPPPAYPTTTAAVPAVAPPAYGSGLTFGTSQGNQPSNTSLFGNAPFGQTSFQMNNSSFQLQKPPTGNKRGKQ